MTKFNETNLFDVSDQFALDEITALADKIEKGYNPLNDPSAHIETLQLELGVLRENIDNNKISKNAYERLKKRLLDKSDREFLQKYISRRNNGKNSYDFLFDSWNLLREISQNSTKINTSQTDQFSELKPEFDDLGLLTKECWDSYVKKISEADEKQEILDFTQSRETDTDSYLALFIDANKLHGLNKDYGQSIGDELIKTVAESIRTPFDFRKNDENTFENERRKQLGYRVKDETTRLFTHLEEDHIATRYGGDEFVLVIKGKNSMVNDLANDLPSMIFQYLEQNPIVVDDGSSDRIMIKPTVGIGYALRNNICSAIKDAEKACFIAKTAGSHSENVAVANETKYMVNGSEMSLVDMYKVLFEHIENSARHIAGNIYLSNSAVNSNQSIEDYVDQNIPKKLGVLLKNTGSYESFKEGVHRAYINTEKDENDNPVLDERGYVKIDGRPFIAERTFSHIYKRLNATHANQKLTEEDIVKIGNNAIDSFESYSA